MAQAGSRAVSALGSRPRCMPARRGGLWDAADAVVVLHGLAEHGCQLRAQGTILSQSWPEALQARQLA